MCSQKALSQARPGRASHPHPKSQGLISEMKRARTVDVAASQLPPKTREVLQSEGSQGPWASGPQCGRGTSCPTRGQFSSMPGKNMLGLRAEVLAFMYPISRVVGVPGKAPRLCQPLPPGWASARSSHLPGSSRTSHLAHTSSCSHFSLLLEGTTLRTGRSGEFTSHLTTHPRPRHRLIPTHRGPARDSPF